MSLEAQSFRIAYFSMEVGLESGMPTYSGGLGVLSGDTLRAAADLGLPMVGVSLLYRQGFFRQHLDIEGQQSESNYNWQPAQYLQPQEVRFSVHLNDHDVGVTAWLYTIRGASGATVPVYFLDTDLPENDFDDRGLTAHLYGGDHGYRLRQEALLGLGGLALLRTLGAHAIETFHMNEGHCALITMGLLNERLGGDLERAEETDYEAIRQQCVFTTPPATTASSSTSCAGCSATSGRLPSSACRSSMTATSST
jgi:starch phosphorylase